MVLHIPVSSLLDFIGSLQQGQTFPHQLEVLDYLCGNFHGQAMLVIRLVNGLGGSNACALRWGEKRGGYLCSMLSLHLSITWVL